MDRPTLEHLYLIFTTVTSLVVAVVYLRVRMRSLRQIQSAPVTRGRPFGGRQPSEWPQSPPQGHGTLKSPDIERNRSLLQPLEIDPTHSRRSAYGHLPSPSHSVLSPRSHLINAESDSYNVEDMRATSRPLPLDTSPWDYRVYETTIEYPNVRYIYNLADTASSRPQSGSHPRPREAATSLSYPGASRLRHAYPNSTPIYFREADDYIPGPPRVRRAGHLSYDQAQMRRRLRSIMQDTVDTGVRLERDAHYASREIDRTAESPASISSSSTPTPRTFAQQQQQQQHRDERTLSQCGRCGTMNSGDALAALERAQAHLEAVFRAGEGQNGRLEGSTRGAGRRLGEYG